MKRTAEDLLTVEDYRAMPVGPPHYQLIDGELIVAPAPNRRHQVIARNVFSFVHEFVRRQSLGEVYFAPVDVYLSEHDVVQPDVFFVAEANRHMLVDEGVHGGPDLVIEILSPTNGQLELRRKRPLYARCGVKEEWLIDPNLEQIHRYDFTTDAAKPVQIIDRDETFETAFLPGLVVSAAEVFKP